MGECGSKEGLSGTYSGYNKAATGKGNQVHCLYSAYGSGDQWSPLQEVLILFVGAAIDRPLFCFTITNLYYILIRLFRYFITCSILAGFR